MKRLPRIVFIGLAAGLWLGVVLTALSHARLAPGPAEDAALADVWRVLAGASPREVGAPWAWTLTFLAQHGVSFAGLIFARWLALGTITLGAAIGVAWLGVETARARVIVLATLGFAALLSAAEAAPWMLASLAIVLTTTERVRGGRPAAAAWLLATLLAPALLVPVVVAIELLAVFRAPTDGSGRSARDALTALGVIAVGWGLVWLAAPGALALSWDMSGRLADPSVALPVPAAGLGLACVFCAVALGAARAGERGAVAFGAAIPFLALGLIRGGPDDVHLGSLPALAVLCLVTVRTYPHRFALFTSAGLAVVLALAGFMPRVDARTAWSVRQLEGLRAPPRADAPSREECEHAPAPMVGQTGAVAFPELMASARCATGIWPIQSPRRGPTGAAVAFAHDEVRAWAERYHPVELVGFDVVRGHRRETPSYSASRPLPIEARELRLTHGAPSSLALGRAVSAEHLVLLNARVHAGVIDAAIGRVPRVDAQMFFGERPVGAAYSVPIGASLDRLGSLILPVDAARAEWRWVAGRHDPDAPVADRLVLTLREGPRRELRVDFLDAQELVPPPAVRPESACVPRARLDAPPPELRSASRPAFDSDVIALREGHEEVAFRVDPCPGVCLLGEAELASDLVHDEARLRGEVRAGPRLLDRFTRHLGREWRRPFEVPVDGATGVRFVADGPVNLYGLRLEPCVSPVSVIHALHSGRHEVIRGGVELSGDTLRMTIPAMGTPPPEVRVPLQLGDDPCFAMDLTASAVDAHIAVVVGVIEADASLYRVDRQVLTPSAHAMRHLFDIDLTPWRGQRVSLYLAAWALDATDGDAEVQIMRPRIHGCGGPALWAF